MDVTVPTELAEPGRRYRYDTGIARTSGRLVSVGLSGDRVGMIATMLPDAAVGTGREMTALTTIPLSALVAELPDPAKDPR